MISDIDETLVYATETALGTECDFRCEPYFVYKRPHLDRFTDYCRANFEVAIRTSAGDAYAECVVRHIFPPDYPLSFIWSRKRCVTKIDSRTYAHTFIKDLKKVRKKGYDTVSLLKQYIL